MNGRGLAWVMRSSSSSAQLLTVPPALQTRVTIAGRMLGLAFEWAFFVVTAIAGSFSPSS